MQDYQMFVIEDDTGDEVYTEQGIYVKEEYIIKANGKELERFDDELDAKHAAVDYSGEHQAITVEDQTGKVVLLLG